MKIPFFTSHSSQKIQLTPTDLTKAFGCLTGVLITLFGQPTFANIYCKPPPNALSCLSSELAPSYQHSSQKWGYVDITGEFSLTPEFDDAHPFIEGLAAVSKDGKWGFINNTGKQVIAADYEAVGDFSEGRAAIIKAGKLGYIDKTGKTIIRPQYPSRAELLPLHTFSEGLAAVSKNDKWGFINQAGKTVIGLRYTQVGKFHEGLAKFVQDGKLGFLDKQNTIIIHAQYDTPNNIAELAHGFDNGVVTVVHDGAYGVVDKQNRIVVPFSQYPYIGNYHNALAVFSDHHGKYGYLSHTGEVMLPPTYDMAYDFALGYGVVEDWMFEERFRVDKQIQSTADSEK